MTDLELVGIAAALVVIAEAIALLLVVDAVMSTRSSQGAIAWSFSLIALPVLTIPLYLTFGRVRFQGYAEALRDAEAEVGERVEDWFQRMNAVSAELSEELAPLETVVKRITGLPFTRGNRVELLVGGTATYEAMLAAIATAEEHVLVQFYIVRDDAVGRRLRDALIERRRAGVHVSFLFDEIGSMQLPAGYLQSMRNAGIEVSGFRTTRGFRNRFQINFRNHRKLLIVDGRTAFIGGHNLGEEYLAYRDTHIRVDGPAAQQIGLSFLKDWYWATRRLPDISDTVHCDAEESRAVATVSSGPADAMPNCSVMFATLFATARRRIWITSPYFVPDDVMSRALQAAALRGVDVRVILPDKADHRLVELASFTYYTDMTIAGVRLYRYRDHFLHQKVCLIDDSLAAVGTVNLDNRSIHLNFEATALVADTGFAGQVEAMLTRDLESSDAVDGSHFDRRPIWFRVAARVARLASPLL